MIRKFQAQISKTGQNISQAREDKGYTQADLAKMSGVSLSRIKIIETGQSNFRLSTLYYIARALKIELGELMRD